MLLRLLLLNRLLLRGAADAATATVAVRVCTCNCVLGSRARACVRVFVSVGPQAVEEAGEPAVVAFEEHSGGRSLAFASAALQVALSAKNNWNK